ncbi:MAG: hypothetical protein E5V25_17935 [Mesorhizobium sp.]|nr:MAG: hypothetical protein E5V25_17935 [Mesorhizobium sp.]
MPQPSHLWSLREGAQGLGRTSRHEPGDVIEGIVLSKARRRFPRRPWNTVGQLKRVYGLELGAADSHGLAETGGEGDDEPS